MLRVSSFLCSLNPKPIARLRANLGLDSTGDAHGRASRAVGPLKCGAEA